MLPPNPALETCLDYQRATLLAKLDGLTQEQAGRRLVGSDTPLHGLARPMTTIEQWNFVECVNGVMEPYPYYDGEKSTGTGTWPAAKGSSPTSSATWPSAPEPGHHGLGRPGSDLHHQAPHHHRRPLCHDPHG